MKLNMKIVLPIAFVVIGFLGMWALLGMKTEPEKREATPRPKVVQAEVVAPETIAAGITAYGRVATAQPVQLYSEVSGTIMEGELSFQPAQSFKKGDLLVKIDDRQAVLQLNSTKSDLMTALASVLPEIKVDFPDEYQVWQDYFNDLDFESRLENLPETDNQKIKLFLSRFNVYKLYFSVRDLEIKLDKHYFYAPFDGSIVSAGMRVGSTARSGSLLGEIINLEDLEVELSVSAQDLQWIDLGGQVNFTSAELPGNWTGKIKRIGSDIDERTQTVPVYVSVDQQKQASLLNGVFLEATMPGLNIDDAVKVPIKALYEEKFVYLITEGKLEYREVEIARQEKDAVIVSGGLQNSDTLVLDAMVGVAPGMPAQPKVQAQADRSI